MQDNVTERQKLAVIAAAAAVPERTLRRQFRQFTGLSPTEYYRKLRLESAHRALTLETGCGDVTAAATSHGFSHFGHFAARYRQRFGELPSDTKRASRVSSSRLPPHTSEEMLSLAILPFTGGEVAPAAMALADSTVDGLLSALSRMRWLQVREVPQARISFEATGSRRTRYALRGRIRLHGGRAQVIVSLVEAATGRHVWGDAFEGKDDSAASLQQRVAEGVAGALPTHLLDAEAERVDRTPRSNRTAYDLAMRAFRASSALTQAANALALEDLDHALTIDPQFAFAAALASWCHAQRGIFNFGGSLEAERKEARRLAELALRLDNRDPLALAVVGTSSTLIGDLDTADMLIAKCLAIDPSCAMAWQRRGWLATYRGSRTAVADFRRSLTCPDSPHTSHSLLGLSTAYFGAGRYEKAAECAARGIAGRPLAIWAYRIAASAQARCGQMGEARRSVAMLLRHYPDLTISTIVGALPMRTGFLARYAEGLESAGMPI